MAKRSSIQYWNFLREDSPLKGVISFRLAERKLTYTEVAEMLDVPTYKVRNYLKSKTPNLNNFEIVKLAQVLGIEISIACKLQDGDIGVP